MAPRGGVCYKNGSLAPYPWVVCMSVPCVLESCLCGKPLSFLVGDLVEPRSLVGRPKCGAVGYLSPIPSRCPPGYLGSPSSLGVTPAVCFPSLVEVLCIVPIPVPFVVLKRWSLDIP